MFLKDHLKKNFRNAFLVKDTQIQENIIVRWVHRFGVENLDDLINQCSDFVEKKCENEYQEKINLFAEKHEKNKKISSNFYDEKHKINNVSVVKNKKFENNNLNLDIVEELPLPNINNLRKWINKDKKAS